MQEVGAGFYLSSDVSRAERAFFQLVFEEARDSLTSSTTGDDVLKIIRELWTNEAIEYLGNSELNGTHLADVSGLSVSAIRSQMKQVRAEGETRTPAGVKALQQLGEEPGEVYLIASEDTKYKRYAGRAPFRVRLS